ncbi:MAG TPA: ribose 5-phosphate isomerase B [Brevefilum fermentans]|jgi:ribose 5-phosphate isomerase B|uniref:Putative sugar phosphate isomerase YwlF (Modular protein) n=1 Tax=Candidatus Brevifilum fermentans TaxID=1986204 RepID=A0A1Y6K7F5_9CHLR|nr:ribose 5-phosphate isomerase B [Brevefilum fermentans]OQB83412.1 MAG: putative sugar phosphate isomerase YwlF [Chloroflexi bacterium ADurb.Bin120]SMX54777.1 Putative sugar phosphate isomerase YwlF (modular protein) [Brevefilum fermentans]HOM66457.1 ribose 5-phosphate isomerase B [Brevefilum fermentans]HPX95052.1 ribose 5-phosphate isomerase B [Brevefilum fermentans]HQA28899.1 ribose 5-phosphate isomerase B [Brevefilum fermentans]
MSAKLEDKEIQEIVRRTVHQTLGLSAESNVSTIDSLKPVVPQINSQKLTVAIGTDHGGVDLKEILKQHMINLGYEVIDCGTHTKDAVDYPDIARAVAEQVASGKAWRGVIIDGAGIGSCIAANKVPGIRAALCYDHATAVNSREHNNANVLTLGAGLTGANLAQQILKTWLETDFGGGRHAKRVDKITAIEKACLESGK